MERPQELQDFLDIALPAMQARAVGAQSRASLAWIAKAAATPAAPGAAPASQPVVERVLEPALDRPVDQADLAALLAALRALAPRLCWRRRSGDATAGPGFEDGHANAMLLGPGGIEDRRDLWIGLSLLAPGIRYPDHQHAPEETYLVLSPGDFWQEDGDWFQPGVGGSFYNPPNILHAMRAGDEPLLALWALRPEREAASRKPLLAAP